MWCLMSKGGFDMRTTLVIDDDVLRAARQLAESSGESIGKALSRLARAGLERKPRTSGHRNGVKLLPVRPGAPGATLEEVNRLRHQVGDNGGTVSRRAPAARPVSSA